ncbi:TIM barrel protein [Solirubrobacter phytolaccae]|uniref:3-dehydroshikimate dehydratase n=1 Tax=Solirubrobacter phytolaccae TaxID=1404360 RepID=A0A9X3NGA4_9ACTN|nr:sugar phosphate isomerase/epimerase and 4-hydroxyphenylpyruvate domain-containing protein [Solirubrobacter phytolaccae]MDA0184794.1 TIM barrel protein [Solirubrobacter phytolaccae]
MRRSIATVCLSGTLDEKLQAASAAGFDGVELFEADLINSPLAPTAVRELADELGLSIDLYQPFRDFEAVAHPDFRRAEAKFDVMEALGAPTMLVCSNVRPDAIDDDALAAEHLHALAARAHERGLKIAYEALAWGRHVSTYDHAWRIVEQADHPALGTCLDSFHILSRGTDLATIDRIPGEKIFYLQLADAPRKAMDVLQWSRHYRCFPGQGALDVAGLLRRVLATGYDGPLSLEVFNDVFRQADARRTAIDAMRSLILLEQTPLPAPAPLHGFAFVEIGVDADSAPDLEALLRAMGFAHAGPHRSKPVQLWEHGAIRVVLNHGAGEDDPEVVAIAVTSEDPAASAERAHALLAPSLERRRGTGEADLTAVAAPDGTAVFFCGSDWLGDFLPTGEPATDGVPIERIDHITLAQPFEAFDEAGLFYRSVLDLEPSESAELAAPDGLVRSRAYAGGDVRVVLNVPALAGHERTELQHVAFATDDALATARALRDRGVPLLEVPDNYYDDLEARLDLDAAHLRELGVLYDRTPEGELLHFYIAPIGGRVFFEVLERRGGYRGYGALNSSVRMAAQSRGERHAEGAGA